MKPMRLVLHFHDDSEYIGTRTNVGGAESERVHFQTDVRSCANVLGVIMEMQHQSHRLHLF